MVDGWKETETITGSVRKLPTVLRELGFADNSTVMYIAQPADTYIYIYVYIYIDNACMYLWQVCLHRLPQNEIAKSIASK